MYKETTITVLPTPSAATLASTASIMDAFHGPKNVINLTITIMLQFFLVPSSEGGVFEGLKNTWKNIFDWYPLTRTLQLNSHIKGGPLHVVCTLHGEVKAKGDFKPGYPFYYTFQEWNNKRNHLKCHLWQRGRDIGWFYPFYYGVSSCENTAGRIWKRDEYICKRQIYGTYADGGKGFHKDPQIFYYQH